jgi:rSAM/selenodomain-associated transferase 1
MKKEVVLVFQKNEVLGKVKTRLASGMGELRALEIYRHLVQMTYSALAEVPAFIWTYFSDFIPKTVNFPIAKSFAQEGQDLGDRMAGAFARSFELGMDKVVLIGTDCPTLQSQHLNEAFEALTHSDLVLGPATDGGYYLIGMKRRADYLFEGISWSTSQVLTETLNVASQHGLTTTLLQELNDIDTSEDWERYTNQIQITSQLKII